jgi:hypothetical protein
MLPSGKNKPMSIGAKICWGFAFCVVMTLASIASMPRTPADPVPQTAPAAASDAMVEAHSKLTYDAQGWPSDFDPAAKALKRYVPAVARPDCPFIVRYTVADHKLHGSRGKLKLTVKRTDFMGKGGYEITALPKKGVSLSVLGGMPPGKNDGLAVKLEGGGLTLITGHPIKSALVCAVPADNATIELPTA